MTIREVEKNLLAHPVVRREISMQAQLGLPYLRKRGERLCLCYLSHRTACRDGKLLWYAPAYRLELVYPFEHIVQFTNLVYAGEAVQAEPAYEADAQWMAVQGRACLERLYAACDSLLELRGRTGEAPDGAVEDYQALYRGTIAELGLPEAVYGGQWNAFDRGI